jgi:DNA helicase-2/ATP-dependent DNA helicase PcrA
VTSADSVSRLNPAQRAVVSIAEGPVLVLAGAGSGKTRVITCRVAELIRRGIPPERILSVTFTNKAAREMQHRVSRLLGPKPLRRPVVCTFHALCVRILREEITALGYSAGFSICDRADQEALARGALREIRVSEKSLRPRDLLATISRWKSARVAPRDALDLAGNDQEALAAAAYRRYQSRLRAQSSVDFDDLLFLTCELFENFPAVLKRHQSRFDQVQIDEYQDTNALQFSIAEALVRPHQNLCVVGDDDQSIYGWRGAEVRHILEFPRVFPGARVIRLEDNYRSTTAILELANRVVSHNPHRHEKRLVAHRHVAKSVRFVEYPDEQSEAEQVVREIAWQIRSKGVDPGDIAILFRTNEQPRPFESELRRARVPYVILGSLSFFDRREIRDLLAWLRTIARPEDEVSLLRIINVPPRGVGDSTVEKLLTRAVGQGASIWNVIEQALAQGGLPSAAAEGLGAFRRIVLDYHQRFATAPTLLHQQLKALIDTIDYEAEILRQYDTPAERELRRAMLAELVHAVEQYAARADAPSLAGFLEEAALTGRDEEADKDDRLAERGVKLMTLHSAKGLEFERVWLVGLEEGLLPHRRSLVEEDRQIEEERRLCYVGITRARSFLTVTRAASRLKWGRRKLSPASRFWYEMRGLEKPDAIAAVEVEFEEGDE